MIRSVDSDEIKSQFLMYLIFDYERGPNIGRQKDSEGDEAGDREEE